LLFSKCRFSQQQRKQLEDIISYISYSCGATAEDLVLPEALSSVCVRRHDCSDHIEKIYYSAFKDDPLCIHCGNTVNLTIPSDTDSFYPFCNDCSSKERMHKRVSSKKWLYISLYFHTTICMLLYYIHFLTFLWNMKNDLPP